jgi:hypothetical protein
MALNLSRNTKVFVSTVNGVNATGAGGLIAVDTVTAGANHAVGDVLTLTGGSGSGAKVIVTGASGGAVTKVAVMNNFRGTGHSDSQAFTQSATSGSGTGFACVADGVSTVTTTFDGARTALGLFKGNEKTANTFKIGVLDGYSFSQANESTDVTISEAGSSPNRGSKRFNDSLAPAEWSFQTYARPFKHGTNSFRAANTMDYAENILWAALSGQAMTTADKDTNAGATTNSGIKYTASTADVDFLSSDAHELLKLQIYFALENTTYRLNECQVNQVEIDFSIDGIATLSWSGNSTTIDQLTSSAAGAIEDPSKANEFTISGSAKTQITTDVEKFNFVDVSGTNDADYLRNKLSSLTLANLIQGGGSASGGLDAVAAYDISIIGGSITIANNITYLTPETLGIVDQPIGSFTGTRQVSGTLNCYLDTKANGSNELLKNLSAATNLVTNSFNMSLFMGGGSSATPVIEFDIPRAHVQIPVLEVADVISTNIEFMALGSNLSTGDEMVVKAKGSKTFSETGYAKTGSNAV